MSELTGTYEIHRDKGGSRVRHRPSGELMHAASNPFEESQQMYVMQSGLRQHLQLALREAVVIWDVGLGAAANAMAALEAWDSVADARDLEVISFENDLSALRLAASRKDEFPYLAGPAPEGILSHGFWRAPHRSWQLVMGDFASTMRTARPPDIVFYDPFSARTNQPMWSWSVLSEVGSICMDHHSTLVTYSVSTSFRAACLALGLVVARGQGSGGRGESTVVFAPNSPVPPPLIPLGRNWLTKWQRSSAPHPVDLPADRVTWFKGRVLGHPQFNRATDAERNARST